MSDAQKPDDQKLAILLLHLELNPDELLKYGKDPNYARSEMQHFGVSEEAIKAVLGGNPAELGKLFKALTCPHVATGAAVVERSRRKK